MQNANCICCILNMYLANNYSVLQNHTFSRTNLSTGKNSLALTVFVLHIVDAEIYKREKEKKRQRKRRNLILMWLKFYFYEICWRCCSCCYCYLLIKEEFYVLCSMYCLLRLFESKNTLYLLMKILKIK